MIENLAILASVFLRDVKPSLAFIYFHRNFKMAFATEENLAFLEEVQKYDCIYNKCSRDFKNKFKKYNCWVQIATKFDTTPEAADKRFKNIRTAYGRFLEKRKNVPSGSGRDAVPTIPEEFANLNWLSTLINHRKTTSYFEPSSVVLDDDAHNSFSDEGGMVDDEVDLVGKDSKDSADEIIDFQAIAEETEIQKVSDSNISGDVDDQDQQSSEKQVKSTSKKKQGTNIRGGKQSAPKAESKEKSWVGMKKKPSKLAIDLALMKTAESVVGTSKKMRIEQDKVRKSGADEEDSLFC